MLDHKIRERFGICLGQAGACRIIRKVDEQDPRLRRDLLLKFRNREAEIILAEGVHSDRHAMRHADQRGIGHETGLMVEDLIARREDRAQGDVESLAHTDCNQDLTLPIIRGMEGMLHVGCQSLPEFRHAEIRSVAGIPAFNRGHRLLTDMPRGLKIRFPNTQRDDILAGGDNIKEVPDSRLGDVAQMRSNKLFRD